MADRVVWRPGQPWPWDGEAPASAAGTATIVLVRRSRRSGARLVYFEVDGEYRYVRLRTWTRNAEADETPRGRLSVTQP